MSSHITPASAGPYLEGLKSLPFVKRVRVLKTEIAENGVVADALVRVYTPSGSHDLLVEEKSSHLGRGIVSQMAANVSRSAKPWILFAPYVGAPLGAKLEKEGINFIDKLGNCYVRLAPSQIVRIQGRRAPQLPARAKSLRAPGYQVLFALLADPELASATVREIAAQAGVSRQPVMDVLARLVEEGFLVRHRRKHVWVQRRTSILVDRFVEGYAAAIRPKLYAGRFRAPPHADGPAGLEAWLNEALAKSMRSEGVALRFGGTAAAYRLDRHYRGPLTTIHFPYSEEHRRSLRASPSNEGELVWLRPLSNSGDRGATDDTVHPLLVYAELAVDPDPRAAEAAQRIREKFLDWGDT